MTRRLLPLLLCLAAPALADDVMTEANSLTAAPPEWLGAEPHFVLWGTIEGHSFAIEAMDPSAAFINAFEGKREYATVDGAIRYVDFEFALEATIGGVERAIELEFANADFASLTLPAELTLQETEFPEGPFASLEVEFEWEAGGQTVNAELGGWTGTLTLFADTGSADAQGLAGDGVVSGYAVASQGENSLTLSFTAPMVEYELD